jgi:hypothetical protein
MNGILVYAYDPPDPEKQRIARNLLRAALTGASVLSTQVLAEFASTLLHKMKPSAPPEQVAAAIRRPASDSPRHAGCPASRAIDSGTTTRRTDGRRSAISFLQTSSENRRKAIGQMIGPGRVPK